MNSTAQSSTAHYKFKDASARKAYFDELEEANRDLGAIASRGTLIKPEAPRASWSSWEEWLALIGGRNLGGSQDTGQRTNSRSSDDGVLKDT